MRLVYLHQYFNHPGMAGSTRSYEFARRWVQDGHEVDIITADRTGNVGRTCEEDLDGIRVHWLPVPYDNSMSGRERLASFAKFALRAIPRAVRLRPDAVLASSTPLTIAVPGLVASMVGRVPFLFEVRDLWPELPLALGELPPGLPARAARLLERAAYRRSAAVIALSPGMADGVRRVHPSARVVVIPNAADLDRFSPLCDTGSGFRRAHTWLGDRPLAVYAGTIGRLNQVQYLVDVAAEAAELSEDACLVVLGAGADADSVVERAKELGVWQRNFFLLPPVAKDEVSAVLAAADVAFSVFMDLPEMEINSANKFFDALSAGVPVAINYGGWHEDLLDATGAGVRLPRDPRLAAERLLSLLRDEEWLRGAGVAARELAEREFSRDRLYPRWRETILSSAKRNEAG